MTGRRLNPIRPHVLLIFLVTFCLFWAGMRVPDISRPHRPKPSQRAVVENPLQNLQDTFKQCGDLFAVIAKLPGLNAPTVSVTRLRAVLPLYPVLFPVFNSGRSPPLSPDRQHFHQE